MISLESQVASFFSVSKPYLTGMPPKAPKAVVDTNVFIASLFPGASRRIVEAWIAGRLTLCLSPEMIDEYAFILGRMPLVGSERRQEWLRLFEEGIHCERIENPPEVFLSEDPSDNKFLATAVALAADAVVSSDRHLLEVGSVNGIPVLKPREFSMRFLDSQ